MILDGSNSTSYRPGTETRPLYGVAVIVNNFNVSVIMETHGIVHNFNSLELLNILGAFQIMECYA